MSERRCVITNLLDLELTIDPTPQGGIFGTMDLYLMACSFQEKNDCKIRL